MARGLSTPGDPTGTGAVEEFFVDFLVRDEGERPWLTKIADEWAATSSTDLSQSHSHEPS